MLSIRRTANLENKHIQKRTPVWIGIMLLASLACNLPLKGSQSADISLTATAVAQQLSATAPLGPTITLPPTTDTGGVATNTPTPTLLPNVTPSATVCIYNGAYVKDVTIPDGTEVTAGTKFTKTWQLKNNGCLDWPAGTKLVFVEGNQMGGPASVDVPATPVEQTRDISVELTAPTAAGEYTGYWKLQSPDGFQFGDRIYVQIKSVAKAETPTPTSTAKEDRPDLTVSSIALSPDPPVIGANVKVIVEILNAGKKDSVKAQLKGDFQDLTAQTAEVPVLKPGEKVLATFNVKYDKAGEYSLSFTIDANNDNVESDETNNKSVKTSKFYTVSVLSTATVTIPATLCLDLETGGTACNADADVWWDQPDSTKRFLKTQNGSLQAIAGLTAVEYINCATTTLAVDSIDGSTDNNKIPDGTYICLKTGKGHFARILIVTYGKDLQVKYTTWELKAP